MASKLSFTDAVVNRRSIYNITSNSPIPDSRIVELAELSMKQVPSSFDSRSTRMVVLLNDEHRTFWDFVKQVLEPQLSDESKKAATFGRLDGFRKGKGTILFLEDPNPIKEYQSKFALYADRFPQWSEHSNAMHQFAMWTALEAEGLGCNLQHYNPLVDNKAKEHWGLDLEWSLKAQLVFGGLGEGARDNLKERTHPDLDKKLKVFGAEE